MTTTALPLRRSRLAVTAVFVTHGLLFASWAAHVPHIKARLGVDNGTLGLALLGTPVGSIVAMAVVARLLPRLGSRRLVAVSLVGYAACGPLVGLASTVWAFVAALFAWGAFQGSLDVSMNTQAIAIEGRSGRALMNGLHGGWSIGAFAGAGIGAAGVAVGVSLAAQLAVLAVVALVAVLPGTRWLVSDAAAARPVAEPAPSATAVRWSGAVLLLGCVAFASMLCEGVPADWASVYLRDSWGASAGVAGLGYTAFALAMTAVRLSGNAALARVARERLLPGLAAVACVGFTVALLVGGVWPSIVGFAVLGAGVGTIVPTVFSAAGELPGRHAGVSVATVSAFGWAGFVCGPPLVGQLAQLSSLRAALAVVSVLTALVALLSARALRASARR